MTTFPKYYQQISSGWVMRFDNASDPGWHLFRGERIEANCIDLDWVRNSEFRHNWRKINQKQAEDIAKKS